MHKASIITKNRDMTQDNAIRIRQEKAVCFIYKLIKNIKLFFNKYLNRLSPPGATPTSARLARASRRSTSTSATDSS